MTAHTDLDAREALAQRLVDDTTHALETLSVYLGLELGLYQTLTDLGGGTEVEIAATTGIAPRYAREWLEQQAAAGYIACDGPKRPPRNAATGCPQGTARCSWTPTAPTTPHRSRSSSWASPGCYRSY
jgi:hypothetical protein